MKLYVMGVVLCINVFTALSVKAEDVLTPLTLQQKRALFIEAIQLFEGKQYQKAVQPLKQLARQYLELQDYVQFFLAATYIKLEDSQNALPLLRQFLTQYPAHPLTDPVRLMLANLLVKEGFYAEAILLYPLLLNRPGIDQAEVYYQFGQALLQTGNSKEAVAALHEVIAYYPGYPYVNEAKQALQKILTTDPVLQPQWTEDALLKHTNALLKAGSYTAAIVQFEMFKQRYPNSSRLGESEFGIVDAHFRSGKTQEGLKTLEQLVTTYAAAQPELAAQALYMIGTKHWDADRNKQATQYMQRISKEYAQTSWGDNACYVLGRIAQSEQNYPDAATWYLHLYQTYPASEFAEEALWRAGWSYYLSQQYPLAVQAFANGLTNFSTGSYYDASLYWQGRTFEKLKQRESAIKTYQQLVQRFSETYYGILAQKRLRAFNMMVEPKKKKSGDHPAIFALFPELQQFLQPANYQEIMRHVEKISELLEVRLKKYAVKEVEWIGAIVEKEPLSPDFQRDANQQMLWTYFLSRLSMLTGKYLNAIQAVPNIKALLARSGRETFPYALDALEYPLAYWELIKKYADQNSLDPFLVAAIIRQESAYDPDALSYAGACGLMQILPKTGKRVAKQVGLKNFTDAQLYDPETNLRLGVAYLTDLLDRYHGDLYRAIAAYNAGPKATVKWWPAKGTGDAEIIVENITYRATRNYVKQVIRNQHLYRAMYAESP